MKRVLLLGGGLQAVSVARSLKECQYTIGILASSGNFALKSSAMDFKIIKENRKYALKEILDIISSERVDIIIPMSDDAAIFLSENKEQIQNQTNCLCAVPEYEILSIAADKLKLMEFCRKNDFPHPFTISAGEVRSYKENIKFPVLIKPNHSVGARGITKVNSFKELEEAHPSISKKYGECHIQEYITGNRPYYNVMIYRDREGCCRAYTILKIIRFYPLQGGSSSMCQTVQDDYLLGICMEILEKLGYHGFADFDVLQTEQGEYKIIEINPRVPASLRGAAVSGINFPDLICSDLLGIESKVGTYSPGKTLRYLGLDIMWFLSSPNRFKASPSWFKFFGKDIYYQEGGWQDIKPMFYSFISNLNKLTISHGRISKISSL